MVTTNTMRMTSVKGLNFRWIIYMLGLVDSFSNKWLAFLWEQDAPHYWLTCFFIPSKMSFLNKLIKEGKR